MLDYCDSVIYNEHLVDVALDLLATSSVIVSVISSNLSHHFLFQNALLVDMRSQGYTVGTQPWIEVAIKPTLKDSTVYRYL